MKLLHFPYNGGMKISEYLYPLQPCTVADPGFPRSGEGGPTPKVGVKSFYLVFFPENCMKIKEIEPPGGARPWCPFPLGSANDVRKSVDIYLSQN